MTSDGNRLGVAKALDFWDQRHRDRGALLSGGDLTYDHASNEIFYALRLGLLLDLIGYRCETIAPLRILDAGCGKGWFSRALATCGHRVEGIDASEHAVNECRRLAVGNDSYSVSRLDEWAPARLYDVVASIDVLFHIMDDSAWAASVLNLAQQVRYGGQLVIADHDGAEDRLWGDYQVTRSRTRYLELLAGSGLRHNGFTPYGFRDNAAGFHSFTRVA